MLQLGIYEALWTDVISVTPTLCKRDLEAVGRVQIPPLLSQTLAALGAIWYSVVWSHLR